MSKPPPKPAKPGQVKVFRAMFTFDPRTPDELYFEEGDILYISDTSDSNWWKGTCRGRTGLIPSNYVAEQAESIDNPMHEAAKRGNLSWLRECLENKVGINGLDKAGNTALYWGCHGGHKDVVEVLLGQSNVELNQQMPGLILRTMRRSWLWIWPPMLSVPLSSRGNKEAMLHVYTATLMSTLTTKTLTNPPLRVRSGQCRGEGARGGWGLKCVGLY
uniref:Osteoclast-stimulating factor 1 n=1 Tax=Esox lucius TaxID=8010 RepID=A0A6Q2WTR0_ESOLU